MIFRATKSSPPSWMWTGLNVSIHFEILEINYGLYSCGLCGEIIALGGTNILKHLLDPKDHLDYFYPRYKNTRHVFLSHFEGICGPEVGYNAFKESWEVRIIGTSENYLYPSNKFSWDLSEDGGGSEEAIKMPGGHHSNTFPLCDNRGDSGEHGRNRTH